MKTRILTLAAAAAILIVSCSKVETENASALSPEAPGDVIKTTIRVNTEDLTKADFNQSAPDGPYAISWQSGDKILVLQQRTTSEGEGNEFTYDGTEYSGTITTPVAGSTWHAFFPYAQYSNFNPSAHTVKAVLPSAQNGSKGAFNTSYLMYRLNKKATSEVPSDQEAETALTDVSLDFTLKGLSTVLKLNVPASLGLASIEMTAKDESDADVYLAGNITLQTAKGDFGMLNGGSSVGTRKGNATKITVTPASGTLSGDVYIYMLPDNYIPSGEDRYYYSTARTLSFTFANESGDTCTKNVSIAADHPLKSGVLYNFGSLPSNLPFAFDFGLTLSTDGTPVLTPTGAPDGAEFYYTYTTDGTEPANPTTSSSSTAPTMSDGRYVKILAHKDGFADKIKSAHIRKWEFGPDSEFWSNATSNGITSGTATTSDITFDTNDLSFTLHTGGKLTIGDGTTGKNYCQFNGKDKNNRPLLDWTPSFTANACLALRVAANGSTARNSYLYKGGSELATISSDASTSAVTRVQDAGEVNTSTAMQLQIGYNGPRYYSLYWLEWGDNVVPASSPSPAPAAGTESISGTLDYDI